MNFQETVRGKLFFDGQLPRLIRALEKIASAMAQTPRPAAIPADGVQPHLLRQLYYGEYEPFYAASKSEEYIQANQALLAYHERIKDSLSPEMRKQMDQLLSLQNARDGLEMEEAFAAGYRCAMQLIAAGLMRDSHAPKEADHDTL